MAALQLANLACWALGVYSLWRLYRLLYGGAHSLVLAACALFLPLGFYVTFIYGTLPGFGLSSFALWQQCAWLRDRAAWRLPPLALAAVAACLIKQNYLIALVGLGLVFAAHALLRDARSLAALALLALVWLGGSRALALGVYRLTGLPQSEGVPPEAYVAMGLQETPPAGPGWFNYYNWQLYAWYGGDAGLAAAHARQDIAAALAAWRQAPAQAAGFMVRKVRSQWCEPTFQSLWIQQRKRDASPDEAVPRLVDALLRPGSGLGRAYYGVFGLAQSAVLLGAALCAARELRRGRVCALALPAVFLGGFLFHLAWEAKGQYTVPYFILLVPLAAAGYAWAGGALARRLPRGSR